MTNKYPGKCTVCGGMVPANGGELSRQNDRWQVAHIEGACKSSGDNDKNQATHKTEMALAEQAIDELKIRQRAYDNGMNEGGYGCYNPYRDELEKRERDEWEKTNSMANTASSGCAACCKTPNRTAQIWEPCDHCGNEPVYM